MMYPLRVSCDAYCRLCGVSNENLIDIFNENDSSICTEFKIRTVLRISVTRDDKLSHRICTSCAGKIQEYYLFIKKCQQIQFQLLIGDTICNTVSIWKMEIEDTDSQPNCIENIKLEFDKTTEVQNEKSSSYSGDDTDESISVVPDCSSSVTRSYDPIIESYDYTTSLTRKKISYSKLANFLRSKVTVGSEMEKSPSPTSSNTVNVLERLASDEGNDSNSCENGSVVTSRLNSFTVLSTKPNKDSSFSERFKNLAMLSASNAKTQEKFDPVSKSISNPSLIRVLKISEESKVFKQKILKFHTQSDVPMNRKKDRNSVRCPYCGETFTSDEFRTEHVILHTEDPNLLKIIFEHVAPVPVTKQLDCEKCRMSFNRELSYIEHMNQHSNIRPVKCHICDRQFFGHKKTRSHFRSAHLVGTFKCESCSYLAKTLSDLEKHRRGVHMNERIMCNVCGKLLSAFSHNMKKHLETHNETRPYKCDNCEASFKTSASLARHRENSHFPVSVMCSACGTFCQSKQKYKKHAYKCKKRLKQINL